MDIKKAFGKSLRAARKSSNLSQEDFSDVSSRTYMSSLERGLKSPTLEKVHSLAVRMDIHPLTLLTLAYLCEDNKKDVGNLISKVKDEVERILV